MSEKVTEEVVEEVVEETTEEVVEEMKTETAFVDSMLEQLTDEDLKGAKMWDNLKGKDANELAQYVKELKSFAGKKGDIPKADATEEEWSEFYGKLGRPDDTDGYEFSMNDEFRDLVGESAPFFEKAIDGFKEQAFKLGATPEKADGLVDWYLSMVADQTTEVNKVMEDQSAANDKTLRTEFGDAYDGIQDGIKAMLTNNGMTQEQAEYVEKIGVFKDPAIAIPLSKIAAKFADDPEIGHHQTKTMSGLKDQLAEAELSRRPYLVSGEKVPAHLTQKINDLYTKIGNN